MSKKQIRSRIFLALILSVSLFLSLLPLRAESADRPPLSTAGKANLSIDFLGVGSTPADQEQAFTDLKKDDVFWVGVRVSDFDNVEDANTKAFFDKGIFRLELGFDYDPAVVRPYNESGGTWLELVEAQNFSADASVSDALKWNSNSYELDASSSNSEAAPINEDNRERPVANGWKMAFVSIKPVSGLDDTSYRLRNVTQEDGSADKYLIRLPFYVFADEINNTNNVSLRFSLGPDTFTWCADARGEYYAQWEAQNGPRPGHNLKEMFDFGGDLDLATGGTVSDDSGLTELEAFWTEDTEEKTADLYQDQALSSDKIGFAADVTEYYVQVPSSVDSILLRFKPGTVTAAVTYEDMAETDPSVLPKEVDVTGGTADTDPAVTEAIRLAEMSDVDTATGERVNGGFNNKITITIGDTTYTVYIQKLFEAKIVLNYGNSPVGLIYADDVTFPTVADKEAATAAFVSDTGGRPYQFKSGCTPTSMDDYVQRFGALSYTAAAWDSYQTFDDGKPYNGDLDPFAQFIYMKTTFDDIGVKATDSDGNVVPAANIKRKLLDVVTFSDKVVMPTYDDVSDGAQKDDVSLSDGVGQITELSNLKVRPGVYLLEYSFDDVEVGTIKATRKVVVLTRPGDVSMDAFNNITLADYNYMKNNYTSAFSFTDPLVKYRIADVSNDAFDNITLADYNALKNNYTAKDKLILYYVATLP